MLAERMLLGDNDFISSYRRVPRRAYAVGGKEKIIIIIREEKKNAKDGEKEKKKKL